MPQFIFEKNMLGNSKINSKLWASKINVPAAKPDDLSSFAGTYMVEVESQERALSSDCHVCFGT